jgi:hypothetical protein
MLSGGRVDFLYLPAGEAVKIISWRTSPDALTFEPRPLPAEIILSAPGFPQQAAGDFVGKRRASSSGHASREAARESGRRRQAGRASSAPQLRPAPKAEKTMGAVIGSGWARRHSSAAMRSEAEEVLP